MKTLSEPMKYLFVLLAFALSACSALKYKDMKKPVVELKEVEMANADAKGANLLFNVQVMNPNDFALEVDSVRYAIEIGGKQIAQEEITEITKVAANTTGIVKIPLKVLYADIFSSIGDFLRNEATAYRLKGSASIGLLNLPFDETGGFKIEKGQLIHLKK